MPSLYETVLGPAWPLVPEPVRRIHGPGVSEGTFGVDRGRGILTTLIAFASGLPSAATAVPVRLTVTARGESQTWDRMFGTQRMTSYQGLGPTGEIAERLGPIECRLAFSAADGALVVRSTGSALCLGPLRIPLPAFLGPAIDGRVTAEGDDARVDVAIRSGWGALLVRYHGLIRSRPPA